MQAHFQLETHPEAPAASIVAGSTFRITVLEAGLLRLEYSPDGDFEDRASQAVLNRDFSTPDFTVTHAQDLLEIDTERLHLVYDTGPFSAEGLSVQAKGGFHSSSSLWRFGRPTPNLGGTARTLDDVDGAIELEDGILSAEGIAVYDDSRTVLLDNDGWIAARRPRTIDLYVFAYGRDYRDALRALYRLTGPQPLLPGYALGNWWSRYHPYTADEYLQLVDKFAAAGIPLSVAVIDMDWHLVDIDPRFGSGWTGYTWNRNLFPDPAGFLAALHERGLAVALNVHPAEGVHAHEERYPAIAERLGIDPASQVPVAFDPTRSEFLEAYLEELHHPLEAEGVDFWWLDWQQGGVSRIAGLDPLWLLNHFHFLDSGRAGRRPLTFSRYAGVGSHRYPIGFSGDTVITWESLDFQPYFTATASNVGYGWWSHDIGGHFQGYRDDELTTRWIQLGVFSPILRLHSGLSPFNTKEPWRFGRLAERAITEALRFRHRLLPYLSTLNLRAHSDGQPVVQPMYYEYPRRDEAYRVRNQFLFGDQLVVVPITAPTDRRTTRGTVRAWLPPGRWTDIFTGVGYDGDRITDLHRDLDSIPVLAKPGAILPLLPTDGGRGTGANSGELEVRLYAGADGELTLAEDADDDARWAFTRISLDAGAGELTVAPVAGEPASIPAVRTFRLVLCGFHRVDGVEVRAGTDTRVLDVGPGPVPASVEVVVPGVATATGFTARLRGDLHLARNDSDLLIFQVLDRAQIGTDLKGAVYQVIKSSQRPELVFGGLVALDLPAELLSALTELLLATPERPEA